MLESSQGETHAPVEPEPGPAAAVTPPSGSDRPGTTITAILISVFLMGAGMGLQGSAVALRGGLEGFSETLVGLIMASHYVGLIVGSMLAPRVIRNVGYVRSFAAAASLGSAAAIGHPIWIDAVAWVVFRAATGLSLSVMFVVAESWLNASSTNLNRGRLLSIYSVVYIVSMGAGQPLMGPFPPASFEVFGVTTVLISFCLMPVTLMRVTGEPMADSEPLRLMQTFNRSPLAGSGVAVSGMVAGATWSLTPLYGQQIGLQGGAVGVLMLLVSLGSMSLQWPMGWVSDRRSRRVAILVSIASATGVAVLIVWFNPTGSLLYLLVFLFGGFGMPLYSLSVALANDQFERHEMVRAAGAIVIYYGIGSVFGPVLASQFMRWFGPTGLFLSMALVLALLLAFVLIQIPFRPALPEQRQSYRLYPRTTASAFQLLRKARRRRRPSPP